MTRHGVVASVLAVSLVLTGCGEGGFSGMADISLPRGADLGDEPYRVTVHFDDALNLVPQASVRVNDVPVGRVADIRLSEDNASAVVTVLVNGETVLPENATARLRQSSLLGAKFVELGAPEGTRSRGRLTGGDVIPVELTGRNPEIEEVLGALSMLLNGGGIAQLRVIVEELNRALSGNEGRIRSLLSRLDEVVGRLDRQKEDITRAIDGLNRLSSTLRAQTGNITKALEDLGPGVKVINEQRDQLVTMLKSLDRLSGVTVDTINRSRQDLIADLRALAPTLRKLAEAGEHLPKALSYLATYPFPDNAVNALKGDYVNTSVEFDLNLSTITQNLLGTAGPSGPAPERGQQGKPTSPALPLPLPTSPEKPSPPPEQPPPPEPDDSGLLGGLLGGS